MSNASVTREAQDCPARANISVCWLQTDVRETFNVAVSDKALQQQLRVDPTCRLLMMAPDIRALGNQGCVSGERLGVSSELVGDEAERLGQTQFTRPQQPAGVAQRAELQGKAKPVAVTLLPTGGEKCGRASNESSRHACGSATGREDAPSCRSNRRAAQVSGVQSRK